MSTPRFARRVRRGVPAFTWAAICLIVIAPPAVAQTWTAAVSTNWNTAGNWNPSGVPNSATADVIFGFTGAGLVNIATSVQAQSLTFDSVAGGAYTLTSSANQTLTGVSAITLMGTISNVQTINLASVATGNLIVTGTGAAALTVDNEASATVSTSPRLVFSPTTVITRSGAGPTGITFTGTGTTEVSGTIGASINGGISVAGPGTVVISGTNNAAGGTNLTGGTLIADYSGTAVSKLPAGTLTLGGGILNLMGNASSTASDAVTGANLTAGHNVVNVMTSGGMATTLSLGAITRSAGGTMSVITTANGVVSTSTALTNGIMGGWATDNVANWLTTSGSSLDPIGAYSADVYSSGTNTNVTTGIVPSSFTTNSLRFNTNVPGGLTMFLANNQNTVQSGGILLGNLSSAITIDGGSTGSLVAGGTGELILNIFTANGLTINAAITAPAGLTKSGSDSGGCPLTLGGSTTGVDGPVNINRGDIRFTVTPSFPSLNFNDNRVGTIQRLISQLGDGVNTNFNGPIRLNDSNISSPNTSQTANIFQNDSPNSRMTLGGTISSPPGMVSHLLIFSPTGSAGFNLTGNNTFTGDVTLNGGLLGIDADASLGNSTNVLTLNTASTTAGGLEFLNNNINVAHLVSMASSSRVISSATDVNTISGVISGNGALVKVGAGTLVLSGTNTWNGSLLIDGGTVQASAVANLGSGTTMSVGGTLSVTNNIFTGRSVLLGLNDGGASSGTFDVPAGKTLTLSGVVSDRSGAIGTLVKIGTGTLLLSNASSTYTGGTDVRQGTVQAVSNGSLGAATAPVTVEPLGTLTFTTTATTGRTFNLTSGTLSVGAGQTLTLSAATIGGGFLRGPGTFALTGGSSLIGSNSASGTVINQTGAASVTNFTNNAQFTNAATQTLTWSNGTNSSAGRLTVNGIVNASEFVSDGTITINPGGSINNSAVPMVLGGGSTTTLGSTGTPGGTIALGGQSLELRGGLLANFGTISGGTLNVYFGGLAAGTGAFPPSVVLHPGGAYTPGVTLANVPVPAPTGPSGAAAISPLDPNQSTAASVLLNANTLATVNTADGTLTFTSPLTGPGKTLTKVGGGTLALASLRAGGLAVNDGTVKILTNGGNSGTSTLNGLSIASGGRLDLTNNKLIVSGGDIGTMAGLVKSGYHGGAWDGPGVMTSAATAATGLGVALADDIGYVGRSFGGVTVAAGDVLVAYALAGDLNLDGAVDFLDLARLAQSYNVTDGTRQWSTGDVNFDGNTDFLDLAKLAQNYNTALPAAAAIAGAPAGFENDLAAAFAQVPEPGSGVLMLLITGLASGRNRFAKTRR